jgi:hypothetical protein
LNEINRYRVAAGLPAVSEQRSWKSGLVHHLHYLERTPDRFMRGMYASWHMENPASPFYTRNGALEGAAANIGIGGTTVDVIDSWWAAPFHAIGMLRPQLRQVELAYADGWADLDVLKGLDPNLTAPRTPVLFPGPDATTNLRDLGAEVPDSRQSCGWQHRPLNQGLPVIALLPSSPANRLTASLWGPTGKPQSTLHRTLCVVDEHTYRSSDPVYGATGRAILQRDHVVILIPAHPLQIGQNVVRIRQRHHATILWRFNVVP